MKLLLDQNIDLRPGVYLRALGHDVTAIAYDYPAGWSDEKVLTIAVKEKRILITYDRADFGELIFRYAHPHCGVLLLRLLTLQTFSLKTRNNDFSLFSRPIKSISTFSANGSYNCRPSVRNFAGYGIVQDFWVYSHDKCTHLKI